MCYHQGFVWLHMISHICHLNHRSKCKVQLQETSQALWKSLEEFGTINQWIDYSSIVRPSHFSEMMLFTQMPRYYGDEAIKMYLRVNLYHFFLSTISNTRNFLIKANLKEISQMKSYFALSLDVGRQDHPFFFLDHIVIV